MNTSHPDAPTTSPDGRRSSVRPLLLLAAVLHLGVGVFPISMTGLLAPSWFAVVAVLAWGLGAVVLARMRHTPKTALLVPVVTAAAWWLAVTLGDVFLGWTA